MNKVCLVLVSMFVTFSTFGHESIKLKDFTLGASIESVKEYLDIQQIDYTLSKDEEFNRSWILPTDEYLSGQGFFTYSFFFYHDKLYSLSNATESDQYLNQLLENKDYENFYNDSGFEIYVWEIGDIMKRCRIEDQMYYYDVHDIKIGEEVLQLKMDSFGDS